MYGNVLNNAQITSLVEDQKKITISGFQSKRLKLAHYPLTAGGVIVPGKIGVSGKRQKSPTHDLNEHGDFTFKPNQYAIVEIKEYLHLCPGVVGHFLPSSRLIEQGFSLTLGKLDPDYGNMTEKYQLVRFGIKNMLDEENLLEKNQPIAHIYFIDLRGLNNAEIKWDRSELERLAARSTEFAMRLAHAEDNGPTHGEGKGTP
ncbi:deoxyUTP pyrophosphatase [Rhizobium sp. CF080]|uniref:dCTP deaminase domain-containing protein n=1 Tax=Rhizobium sp. (strain CF080) TaxID=1144310 RepID=UPI000271B46A|nr:hypothetical protein [Rhizobium sp. CF080]EUB95503.1 deoxyUTP pyrophosphatase [Rhizobium sp. CF080]